VIWLNRKLRQWEIDELIARMRKLQNSELYIVNPTNLPEISPKKACTFCIKCEHLKHNRKFYCGAGKCVLPIEEGRAHKK